MTQIFAVDEKNDLYLDDRRNLAISTGAQAVLEQCEHVMKVALGEIVLDVTRGVLSFDDLLSGSPNLLQFEFRSRNALQNVDGVEEVRRFNYTFENNVIEYDALIKTEFSGEIQPVSSEIILNGL